MENDEITKKVLESKKWQARTKEIDKTITVQIDDPYNNDNGTITMHFVGPNDKPIYAWHKPGHEVSLELQSMPEGCGMIVVHGFWGFAEYPTEYGVMMEFLEDYTAAQARSAAWGSILLATTSSDQPKATKWFQQATGWKQHVRVRNPRSGATMYLWSKNMLARTRKTKTKKVVLVEPATTTTLVAASA